MTRSRSFNDTTTNRLITIPPMSQSLNRVQPIRSVKGTRDLLPRERRCGRRWKTKLAVFSLLTTSARFARLSSSKPSLLRAASKTCGCEDERPDLALIWMRVPRRTELVHRLRSAIGIGRSHPCDAGRHSKRQLSTFRPEATASVVRAYIEHSLYNEGGVHKLYYIGPMFRRDRPRKAATGSFTRSAPRFWAPSTPRGRGSVRGAHAFSEAPRAARFHAASQFSRRQELPPGLRGSPAHGACRRQRSDVRRLPAPRRHESPARARLQGAGRPTDYSRAAEIIDHLCADCRQHFDQVRAGLDRRGIAYQLAPRLVRGLDYYTRTTYEITSDALGAQNSILGGGRYDGLSEMLGGPPAPGTGFAIGEDRLVLAVEAAGALKPERSLAVYVAWLGDAAAEPAEKLARELRERGLSVEIGYNAAKLKKSRVREDGEVSSQIGYDREPRKKALGDPISWTLATCQAANREGARQSQITRWLCHSMAKGSDTNYLRLVRRELGLVRGFGGPAGTSSRGEARISEAKQTSR